ncbi:MAG: hypothetical protein JWR84_4145, partial [Caulobacter sp.]|nr:hypothetical protein [Caulobacter sp.]
LAVWTGTLPGLPDRPVNLELELPKAPKLPATPNPEPLPIPSPAKPG